MTKLTGNGLDVKKKKQIVWVYENPGLLTRIAREMSCTQPFVSRVLYGDKRSRDGRIEEKLAELGAPGFKGWRRKQP
jgi:hypothetical protein